MMESSELIHTYFTPSSSRYEEVLLLHHGSMFDVYTARYDDRKWIIKSVSSSAIGEHTRYLSILQREYAILQQCDSPFVVRAREWCVVDALGWSIVEEYVDGLSLSDWLQLRPRYSKRCKVLNELLEVVDYLHTKAIVHGDIKPQNILITRNGDHVKMIDFGLSDVDNAVQKNIGCTPDYAAPEQSQGYTTDCRTDVYALGHILHLLFPHGYPFIRRKCLAQDAGKRYADVRAIERAIRNRKAIIIIGCMLVAMAAFLGGTYEQMHHREQQFVREQWQGVIQPPPHQSTDALLQSIHQQYDSMIAIYEDSLRSCPLDSERLYIAAITQISDRMQAMLAQDPGNATTIYNDYIQSVNLYVGRLRKAKDYGNEHSVIPSRH